MPQQLLDLIERVAAAHQGRGEGVAQVMHTKVLQPRRLSGRVPGVVEHRDRLARIAFAREQITPPYSWGSTKNQDGEWFSLVESNCSWQNTTQEDHSPWVKDYPPGRPRATVLSVSSSAANAPPATAAPCCCVKPSITAA